VTATVGAETCRIGFGFWLDRVAAGQDVVVTRRGKPVVRLTAAAPASSPASSKPAAQVLLPPVIGTRPA